MTIAIGGWVLLSCVVNNHVTCTSVNELVTYGAVVRGFDTAEDCEHEHAKRSGGEAGGLRCVPALALVNR